MKHYFVEIEIDRKRGVFEIDAVSDESIERNIKEIVKKVDPKANKFRIVAITQKFEKKFVRL